MNSIKHLSMLLLTLVLSVSVISCSKDDVTTITDIAGQIAGTYNGDLKRMSDGTIKTGYVTFTRVSDTSLFLTLLKCESLNVDVQNNYELVITEKSGSYQLASGSSYQISGSVTGKKLELTIVLTGGNTYVFSGNKS